VFKSSVCDRGSYLQYTPAGVSCGLLTHQGVVLVSPRLLLLPQGTLRPLHCRCLQVLMQVEVRLLHKHMLGHIALYQVADNIPLEF
jgi:hypothetical protein